MSHFITESERSMLSRAASDRKLAINADMFSDRVWHCMCYRVIAAGSDPQVVLSASYIDDSHSVESQMVLNYGKCPSVEGTNVCADSDTTFCTFVTYITSHRDVEHVKVRVFRQLDDGQYVRCNV